MHYRIRSCTAFRSTVCCLLLFGLYLLLPAGCAVLHVNLQQQSEVQHEVATRKIEQLLLVWLQSGVCAASGSLQVLECIMLATESRLPTRIDMTVAGIVSSPVKCR